MHIKEISKLSSVDDLNKCFKITLLDGAFVNLTKRGSTCKECFLKKDIYKKIFENGAPPGVICISYSTIMVKTLHTVTK